MSVDRHILVFELYGRGYGIWRGPSATAAEAAAARRGRRRGRRPLRGRLALDGAEEERSAVLEVNSMFLENGLKERFSKKGQ